MSPWTPMAPHRTPLQSHYRRLCLCLRDWIPSLRMWNHYNTLKYGITNEKWKLIVMVVQPHFDGRVVDVVRSVIGTSCERWDRRGLGFGFQSGIFWFGLFLLRLGILEGVWERSLEWETFFFLFLKDSGFQKGFGRKQSGTTGERSAKMNGEWQVSTERLQTLGNHRLVSSTWGGFCEWLALAT